MLSKNFCVGVRDPRCNPKSSVAQKKTHGQVYHLDLELSDRSRDWLPIGKLHWVLVSGKRLGIWVSLVLLVTIGTLGIGMCERVGE